LKQRSASGLAFERSDRGKPGAKPSSSRTNGCEASLITSANLRPRREMERSGSGPDHFLFNVMPRSTAGWLACRVCDLRASISQRRKLFGWDRVGRGSRTSSPHILEWHINFQVLGNRHWPSNDRPCIPLRTSDCCSSLPIDFACVNVLAQQVFQRPIAGVPEFVNPCVFPAAGTKKPGGVCFSGSE